MIYTEVQVQPTLPSSQSYFTASDSVNILSQKKTIMEKRITVASLLTTDVPRSEKASPSNAYTTARTSDSTLAAATSATDTASSTAMTHTGFNQGTSLNELYQPQSSLWKRNFPGAVESKWLLEVESRQPLYDLDGDDHFSVFQERYMESYKEIYEDRSKLDFTRALCCQTNLFVMRSKDDIYLDNTILSMLRKRHPDAIFPKRRQISGTARRGPNYMPNVSNSDSRQFLKNQGASIRYLHRDLHDHKTTVSTGFRLMRCICPDRRFFNSGAATDVSRPNTDAGPAMETSGV